MLKVSGQNTNNTVAKSNNKIVLTKYRGAINGRSFPEPAPEPSTGPSLDFSIDTNSQYIPVI